MGAEPVDNRGLEIGQGVDHIQVAVVAYVLDVLNTGGYFGVRREGEDYGFDGGGVGVEERG